jgi:phage terminase large subunit-like protein
MLTRVSADWLSRQPQAFREEYYASLSDQEWKALEYDWNFWARDNQLTPGLLPNGQDWRYWLILAGRGYGKTRSGAEWVRQRVQRMSLVNLIAATADDARDIMVEGESGILAICPNGERPRYVKSERKLVWPNGAISLIFTADEPERLRGKQHCSLWADELAAWRYPEAWDQAMFGLRIGLDPRAIITTTPKPTQVIKDLIANEWTYVTYGTTYDNRANLAPAFYQAIIKKYEGTRLGRQELLAQILDDNPNALWQRTVIDALRVNKLPPHVQIVRVVIGVDPQSGEDGAETGIIGAGLGSNGHGYVLDDRSLRGTPGEWANAVDLIYDRLKADRVVAEINQGGKMVEHTIRTVNPNISYTGVHAKVGKKLRAEPVSALYEQGKVHHVGTFGTLEDQQCQWTPGEESPDRMDALVYALTELMVEADVPAKGYGF